MKRGFDKINEKLKESEAKLPQAPITYHHHHPPARIKCTEKKITEINKKIRRAKNSKNKKFLTAKREALKAELNLKPEPRLQEGAFGRVYRRYRTDGLPKTNPNTFFSIIRRSLIDTFKKESRTGAVRTQTTAGIRFKKDNELIDLAFNSRMMNIYNLSNLREIVDEMINICVNKSKIPL